MATGTWQRTPGPPGPAHYMAADAHGNLYTAWGMNVYRRATGAVAWTQLPVTGLPTGSAKCLICNALGEPLLNMCGPGGVFFGIFRFRNGVWTRSTGISATTDFYNDGVQGMCLDQNGNVMAVTAWAGNVFRSTDGGSTFAYLATPAPLLGALWTIALGPDGRLWTSGEAPGVWSSHDGVTWYAEGEAAGYKGNLFALAFAPDGHALVARVHLATGSPMQKQVASGQAWVDCVGLPAWYTPNPVLGAGGKVYAIDSGKFFSSADGLHYTIEAEGLTASDHISNFCIGPSGTVYALNSDYATSPPRSELLMMQAAGV